MLFECERQSFRSSLLDAEKSLRKNKITGKSQDCIGPRNELRPILGIKVGAIYLPLDKCVEEALQEGKATAFAHP